MIEYFLVQHLLQEKPIDLSNYLFYSYSLIFHLGGCVSVCACARSCVTRTGLEARQLAQLADTGTSFFNPFPFLWPGPWAGQENSCQRNVCVDDKPFLCKLGGCHQPVQTKWLWASVDFRMDREPQVC